MGSATEREANPYIEGDLVQLNKAGRRLFKTLPIFGNGKGKVVRVKYKWTVTVKWKNGGKDSIMIDYIEPRDT